ncbi:MAG TPA: kelch repeat-containing protein [Planctomycetota bacterium]|nr:kelch repeat-containing protein [Planctomycetota bacterium]
MTRSALLAVLFAALAPQDRPKPYRLPSTDLKQRVIWGSTCEVPDGPSLAFGGQDQQADDGNPHTRIKLDGQWKPLDLKGASLRGEEEVLGFLRDSYRRLLAKERFHWFQTGEAPNLTGPLIELSKVRNNVTLNLEKGKDLAGYELAQALRAGEWLKSHRTAANDLDAQGDINCEIAGAMLGMEPPPRALSPIAYDAATKLFVIFGGDHLDYLTNDTWVFDPAKQRWFQRHPADAPPPRANHVLKAVGDGKIVLSGGYTYTSSTDYCGGQFRDIGDGEWTYDVAADRWSGPAKGVAPETRTYRTGRLHPDYYRQGPPPDPKAFAERLSALPANTWTLTKPPHLPALNRDWGTAVLDPDRDLILRWSGGHSAHGGTDVIQYHLATNRWELPNPVEFPLGQLYSNTDYPEGVNFNKRPWITGHTYQNYGYDPNFKELLFAGRNEHCYTYDPTLGDWTGRFKKPKGMSYGSCFYTLTITSTPQGLVCWTNEGKLFRYQEPEWKEIELKGAKLPGSVVDNSTMVHDSKRDRLLFLRKSYGDKAEYDGILHVVDLKSGEVSAIAAAGKEKAGAIPYLCQFRYDPANDLLLGGCTLPPDADGFRRTPAYDCAGDRWVSLKIGGDDPSGKKGRNVSLGMMWDAKRKLFWAVDTSSNVYVLRLDVAGADLKPI